MFATLRPRACALISAALLGACAASEAQIAAEPAPAPGHAAFDWFEYQGRDPVFDAAAPAPGQYLNPILAGFYPDPGLTQADGDYYLVTSTFSYFPGIPVFHSRDLVNWTQLGNAIDRPGMLDFKNLGMSRGVFAPTIRHHDGLFYIANTCVDCGGNFIVTASDPAGPWSDPVWLPEVGGIDPSLFFDDDGTIYLMNNDAPAAPERYPGHRAIWIRAIDPQTFQSVSEPTVLIDGGVRPEENPIWIEGPNLYRHDGWHYLSAAEGGTEEGHSQVILRSRDVLGPYQPCPCNPILTQRHLPADRANPITSVGHASFVTTPDGRWWTTFLGTRPYDHFRVPQNNRVTGYYNTGRETFLMPVRWDDGWPIITAGEEVVPHVAERPALPPQAAPPAPTSGNFTVREEFDGPALAHYWMTLRGPEGWPTLSDGALTLRARPDGLGDFARPSYVSRRQQHAHASASTALRFDPAPGEEAGLVAFQNDEYWYFIGVTNADGRRIVRLKKRAGPEEAADGVVVASSDIAARGPIHLRIDARGAAYDFLYGERDGDWRMLHEGADAKILSTRVAGGFIGVTFGLYAHAGAP